MCRSPEGNNLDSFMFSLAGVLLGDGSSVLVKQLI